MRALDSEETGGIYVYIIYVYYGLITKTTMTSQRLYWNHGCNML